MSLIKFDYNVVWTEFALNKLKRQVDYIFSATQSPKIAKNFYTDIQQEVEKLSFTAGAYRLKQKKELIIKKRFKIKFLISGDNVYIVDFQSTRQLN